MSLKSVLFLGFLGTKKRPTVFTAAGLKVRPVFIISNREISN